ncbi:ABC transporter substrate-binding protein [Mesorhizobium sp. M2E.F.Ca.ET.219.01.1.1]|uniref:ABC transporter substrate-binding protein n=1 Tax=Mesorhizobium sp. M2E.F.Ca.ET.219.01.1.1 TaxID=2500530 RepID=UPI000FDC79C7|nr:ABC transporter substrate-binding protein [Mesorhizobium sp. M2E.F.Ca.ET.219.01.1.1]TGQ06715.1 ABC transporter substrate-binding protein [Mesorhizobium sp. M2E.F.Ca.ET.219.01.1.1]
MTKRNEIDALRNLSGDIWNVAVDEYAKGYLKRRDLLKYATLIGLTGFAASQGLGFSRARAAAAGGTVRVGLGQPTKAIDPVTVTDPASIGVLSQVGEYLILDDPKDGLQPKLALSWEADETAKRWTFKLRPGVKFHDGRTVTAKDVVASFERLVDPNSGSSALSAYKGILSKGGAKIVDDETVAFDLDQSNSNFPFYVSSDVYNAVILPADYAGDFEKNFNGTGPFKLESFRPKQGASFVRNPDYWGDKALPDRIEIKFFDDEQAQVVALQAGQLDVIPSTTRLELAIEGNPNFKLLSVQASSHDVVHLRTYQAPFTDKRIRRALALTLDREAIVKGLLKGRAIVGNDTPFAPIFPSADPSVPQRKQDIAEAKRLLAEAGVPNGFEVTLTTERAYDIPDYAVIIQNFAKKAGIDIKLNVLPQDAYYGSATFGSSPWLDSNLGITDFGHRGTPDIFLNATLKSDGAWNAAHFKNADYDALLVEYGRARDLQTQRIAAGKIQTLLLDETPEIISYFSQYSRIASAKVEGVRFTAISHLLLDRVSFVQA